MINWQTHFHLDNDIILNFTFYEIKHTIKVIVFIAILSLLANTSQYVLIPPHKFKIFIDVACMPSRYFSCLSFIRHYQHVIWFIIKNLEPVINTGVFRWFDWWSQNIFKVALQLGSIFERSAGSIPVRCTIKEASQIFVMPL